VGSEPFGRMKEDLHTRERLQRWTSEGSGGCVGSCVTPVFSSDDTVWIDCEYLLGGLRAWIYQGFACLQLPERRGVD
jgi:hypothetical protein